MKDKEEKDKGCEGSRCPYPVPCGTSLPGRSPSFLSLLKSVIRRVTPKGEGV